LVALALKALSFLVLVGELPVDLAKANTLKKSGETLALELYPCQTLLAVEGELVARSAAQPVPNTIRQIIIPVRLCQELATRTVTLPLAGVGLK
jgi:hypothetical protein